MRLLMIVAAMAFLTNLSADEAAWHVSDTVGGHKVEFTFTPGMTDQALEISGPTISNIDWKEYKAIYHNGEFLGEVIFAVKEPGYWADMKAGFWCSEFSDDSISLRDRQVKCSNLHGGVYRDVGVGVKWKGDKSRAMGENGAVSLRVEAGAVTAKPDEAAMMKWVKDQLNAFDEQMKHE